MPRLRGGLGDMLGPIGHDANRLGAQRLDRRPRLLERHHGEGAVGAPAAPEQRQHERAAVEELVRGPDRARRILERKVGQHVADSQALLGDAQHAQAVELVLEIGPVARRQLRHVAAAQLQQRLREGHAGRSVTDPGKVRKYLARTVSIAAGYGSLGHD